MIAKAAEVRCHAVISWEKKFICNRCQELPDDKKVAEGIRVYTPPPPPPFSAVLVVALFLLLTHPAVDDTMLVDCIPFGAVPTLCTYLSTSRGPGQVILALSFPSRLPGGQE